MGEGSEGRKGRMFAFVAAGTQTQVVLVELRRKAGREGGREPPQQPSPPPPPSFIRRRTKAERPEG